MSKRLIGFTLESTEFPRETRSEISYKAQCLFNYLTRRFKQLMPATSEYKGIVVVGVIANPKIWVNSEGFLNTGVVVHAEDLIRLNDLEFQERLIDYFTVALEFASSTYSVPVREAQGWIKEFRDSGYVNRWIIKKRALKGSEIQIELWGELDIKKFAATLQISKSGNIFRRWTILETKPDAIFFQHKLKQLIVEGDRIRVLDTAGEVIFEVDSPVI